MVVLVIGGGGAIGGGGLLRHVNLALAIGAELDGFRDDFARWIHEG